MLFTIYHTNMITKNPIKRPLHKICFPSRNIFSLLKCMLKYRRTIVKPYYLCAANANYHFLLYCCCSVNHTIVRRTKKSYSQWTRSRQNEFYSFIRYSLGRETKSPWNSFSKKCLFAHENSPPSQTSESILHFSIRFLWFFRSTSKWSLIFLAHTENTRG